MFSIHFDKTNKLLSKSTKIVNIFTKTIRELESINSQIETENEIKKEEVRVLNHETETLEEARKGNANVITKLQAILS